MEVAALAAEEHAGESRCAARGLPLSPMALLPPPTS